MLRAGGNAFDAALAAGFASTVCEPALTSLGGGGFLLAHTSAGEEVLFDFFVDTPGKGLPNADLEPHFFPITVHFPGSDQDFNVGLGSVAVPGNLKGFLHVHQRLGRMPLEAVIAPAVRLAREGVELSERQAYFLSLLEPIMTHAEAGRAIYAPSAQLLQQGDTLHNPELASFLEALPEDGGAGFYAGGLARLIEDDMQQGQGILTAEDLAAYRVVERKPLDFAYRDFRVVGNPSPSLGGSLIALSFALLGKLELSNLDWGSAGHLRTMVAMLQQVDALRAEGRTSPAELDEFRLNAHVEHVRGFSRGTTHISVADGEGNLASMTTSNGEGSGYLVPGTGIMLNNMMGEDDLHPEGFHSSPPGLRVASMMSPSLVMQDGKPKLVIGSGGSKRIRAVLVQVMSSVLDFEKPVDQAVAAPRLHWDGETIQVEPGYDEDAVRSLEALGPVNVWSRADVYFGGVHAVIPGEAGAGDARRGGHAEVVD